MAAAESNSYSPSKTLSARSPTKQQSMGEADDFMKHLYPRIKDERALFRRSKKVSQALDKCKFNYREMQRAK